MTMIIKDQWDKKFAREMHFMPFGSLMNAYANMHQQHPVDLKQFKKDAMEIFYLAVEMSDISYSRENNGKNNGQETDLEL